MKQYIFITVAAVCLSLTGCKSEPSLQKYFVENTENKDFIAMDVSPSVLNMDVSKLSEEQGKAYKTFEKMNVLAFKLTDKNKAQFEVEREKVTNILKDKKYQQLMKYSSGKEGASVSFVGTDEHIEEFVLFANQEKSGFAVIRILGKDMSPNSMITLASLIKDSKIDLEQLKPLQKMFK
jgi:hypothetical protein